MPPQTHIEICFFKETAEKRPGTVGHVVIRAGWRSQNDRLPSNCRCCTICSGTLFGSTFSVQPEKKTAGRSQRSVPKRTQTYSSSIERTKMHETEEILWQVLVDELILADSGRLKNESGC